MKKLLLILILGVLPMMAAEKAIHHSDRASVKMLVKPAFKALGKTAEDTAQAFVRSSWQRLGLAEHAQNVVLVDVKPSLTATHYRFQQRYQDIPVEQGFVTVSIAHEGGHVLKVFNSTWPEPANAKRARLVHLELDSNEALDMAWQHLRVHGQQTAPPQSEKVWRVVDGQFQLAWKTLITPTAPAGHWAVYVDAMNGKVLDTQDIRLNRKAHKAVDYTTYEGPLTDRLSDTQRIKDMYDARLDRHADSKNGKRENGNALVFDPDPRTTLQDVTLNDESDAAAFENAYLRRDLMDLTVTNGTYTLVGPYVSIQDWDPGRLDNPTTTSNNGVWDARRGNTAFDDVNVYYHIDSYQRYVQSLGFTGEKSIQNGPIVTDTDGAFGDDQSFFYPGLNQLTFGHGCVNDTEDVDVVLHEYGHALHNDINGGWSGGDTGAIGEGFGDYLAGSYSYGTEHGPDFFPAWAFTWDGHAGSADGFSDCWPGRYLDRITARYNPDINYGDHITLPDGSQSDELWSTPLFQAMIELVALGVPREEADAIVLEGLYGTGFGTKMNELAASTVLAAETLFPGEPHAGAFERWFKEMEIITPNRYISAHVPPDNDWTNIISVTNVGAAATTVSAVVYEAESGLDNFTPHDAVTFDLGPGETHEFDPAGSNQRWVEFTSEQPLEGNFSFSRSAENRGQEKVIVPLFKRDEEAYRLTIPHIPADRNFVTGAVFLNPTGEEVSFEVDLYGPGGSFLNTLLNDDIPSTLGPYQKWVGFLYTGPNGEAGLFDDSESETKVSYMTVNTDFNSKMLGFELFSYASDGQGNSPLSTATIKALPDNDMQTWPVRLALTDADYASFSMLNTGFGTEIIRVTVYAKDGTVLANESVSVPRRSKLLGLNIDDGANQFFRFPFNSGEGPIIELDNPQDIGHVILSGSASLHVFELIGTGAVEIDGGAVTALGNSFDFAKPEGVLHIFSLEGGNVTISTVVAGQTQEEIRNLVAGETLLIDVAAGAQSLNVSGNNLSVSVINHDGAAGSITAVNGGGL